MAIYMKMDGIDGQVTTQGFDKWIELLSTSIGIHRHTTSGAGGKAFVSGADISKFESERANAEAQVRYDAISKEGYEALYDFPKPTIAMVQGKCIAGGLMLAWVCDIIIASDDATFGLPEVASGYYRLVLDFVDTHSAQPPGFTVGINVGAF